MMPPLLPMFPEPERQERQRFVVINCLVDSLEGYLNEWAAKGYYTFTSPQVYMAHVLGDGPLEPYVVQIVEYDETRFELESGQKGRVR